MCVCIKIKVSREVKNQPAKRTSQIMKYGEMGSGTR